MKQVDIDRQLRVLRSMDRPWLAPTLTVLMLLSALALSYQAFAAGGYGLLFVALILALFAWVVRESTPHVQRAVLGIESADRRRGQVRVWTAISTDDVSYYA